MLTTPREQALLDSYYATREAFVVAARHIRGEAQPDWEARMEAARRPFEVAERELIEDILTYGDIETDRQRYSVRWVQDLRCFRLKVDHIVKIIRVYKRESQDAA